MLPYRGNTIGPRRPDHFGRMILAWLVVVAVLVAWACAGGLA